MQATGKEFMLEHTEAVEKLSAFDPSSEHIDAVDAELERRVRNKCDLNLLPVLFILLLFSFLDRVNIGNARIQGLEKDLHMKGNDFNIALFIFFVTYILCEIPSNLMLKHVRPSIWLSGMIFCWGVITTLQGIVQSFAGLVVCRFLLGAFEAGFFPGAIYLISMFYKRHEVQLRITIFFSGSIIAGALSGLLAYALANMQGIQGYSAWRWIFIIEGIATCVAGAVSYFFIPDWPETARFLSQEERAILIRRLAADSHEGGMTKLNKKAALRLVGDVKIYLSILMYIGVSCTGYSASFFIPTILTELGWTAVRAQVMTIPIYICATVVTLCVAVTSDIIRHRYAFVMLGCVVAVIGYSILLNTLSVGVYIRYMALFFITTGGFIAQPVIVAWLNNNMGGHIKRGFGTAAQIGLGNTAGLIASNIYLPTEKPTYKTGYRTGLSLILMTAATSTALLVYCIVENKNREQGKRNYRLELPADEIDNLGDDHPAFRFTY